MGDAEDRDFASTAPKETISRGTSEWEWEILQRVKECSGPVGHILPETFTNKGHPAIALALGEGIFFLTVERISTATIANRQ